MHIDRLSLIRKALSERDRTSGIDIIALRKWLSNLSKLIDELTEHQSKMKELHPRDNLLIPIFITATGYAPRISFDMSTIHSLLCMGYTQKEIAGLLDISDSTLYRRLAEDPLPELDQQTIDLITQKTIGLFPTGGIRVIQGACRALGFAPTRQAIQDSIIRVDPWGSLNRTASKLPIRVRKYWSPYPNAVWHFDGHEKLVRWHIWIHGCVDGYSKRIIWLCARSNKQAATVRALFIHATQTAGHPERVRCDKGRENVGVLFLMHLYNDGFIKKPVLTGRSVHNTRIERLWREVHRLVGFRFKAIFTALSNADLFSFDSPVDEWILHQIFLPVINRSLQALRYFWDFHRSRSSSEKSPIRMWTEGMLRRPSIPEDHIDTMEEIDEFFAIDETEEPIELQEQEENEERAFENLFHNIKDLEELEENADSEHVVNGYNWKNPLPRTILAGLLAQYRVRPEEDDDEAILISKYRGLRQDIYTILSSLHTESNRGS